MDPRRFDNLAKTLSGSGTRRGIIRLLAALPLGVTLSPLRDGAPDAEAKKDDDQGSSHRRHRRKARHRHDPGKAKDRPTDKSKGNGKGQRKDQKKDRDKKTGQGKSKRRRHGQNRPPGPSPEEGCTPESTAQTCAGTCATVTNNCGTAVDCGSCACGGCQICQFCDADTGQCVPNDSVAGQVCGAAQVCQAGGSCACDPGICAGTGPGMSCDGGPTPGVCGCTPETDVETCDGQCGEVRNNCGVPVDCGDCTCDPPCDDCQSCNTTTGQCENQSGACCQSGAGRCQAGTCQPCANGQRCVGGSCKSCVCNDGSGCFTTIQAAVDAASPGATIEICAGPYVENVIIDRDLTLIGAGRGDSSVDTILLGTGSDRVVTINAGTVTLQDLRITGGFTTEFGAGIYHAGVDLTLTSCTVTDNHGIGSGQGGGIAKRFPGMLQLTGCTVSANTAFNGGGILIANGVTATLTRSVVRGNDAVVGDGGGIYNFGTVTLDDSSVLGNRAGFSGGGINNGGDVNLLNASIVSGNTAAVQGGGIDNEPGASNTVTITDSFVTGNRSNGGPGSGGGIYNQDTVVFNSGSLSFNVPDDCFDAGSGTGCP